MGFNPFGGIQRSRFLPSSSPSALVINSDGVPVIEANYTNAEAAFRNSDVYGAVSLIASDVATCDIIMPEPWETLFHTPNNLTNEFAFWQTVVASLCLTGNAYVTIDRAKDKKTPTRLEIIPPTGVEITLLDDAVGLQYTITYEDERERRVYDAADMFHFRLMSFGDQNAQYIGVSPLKALNHELAVQDKSVKMSLNALAHAINPSYTLTAPEGVLDASAKNTIREEFEKQNTGNNAGKPIVLDQGLALGTLKVDTDIVKELQNVDWTRNQIAKVFGIPADMLNLESAHSNIDQIRSFYATSLNRYIHPIVSELTAKIGTKIEYDISPAVDPDGSARLNNLIKLATAKTTDPETKSYIFDNHLL